MSTATIKQQFSERHVYVAFVVLMALSIMATVGAHAGTDATFLTVQNLLTSWINGSYGRIVAIGAVSVGLAIAIVKQSLMFAVAGVGIAIVANAGPAVLNGIVTATL